MSNKLPDISSINNSPEYEGFLPLGLEVPELSEEKIISIGNEKYSLLDLENSLKTHPDVKELLLVKRILGEEAQLYVFVAVQRTMPSITTFRTQLKDLLPIDKSTAVVCNIQMIASFPQKNDGSLAIDTLIQLVHGKPITEDLRATLLNPDVLDSIEMGLL